MLRKESFSLHAPSPKDAELKSDKAFLSFVKETFDEFLKFYE